MRILVMYPLFEEKLKPLKEKFETDIIDYNPSEKDLRNFLREYDGIISLLSNKFKEEMFEGDVRTKIIANYAVGYDNIPIDVCRRKGIVVTNTPDVLTRATAELSFALLMSVTRNVLKGDKLIRENKWKGWAPDLLLGYQLNELSVGIIGCGRIGFEMAKLCHAFNMHISYFSRERKEYCDSFANYEELDSLIKSVDVLSIHVPLTNETKNLISKERIFSMKKGSILINTARGDVVDEDALIEALKNNHLYGAGLDVYQGEPNLKDTFRKLDNVILLPHLGSATFKARYDMAELVVNSIIDFFEGREPKNRVV